MTKKKRKVLVVFDTAAPPPADQDYSKDIAAGVDEAEYDVYEALVESGHDVRLFGVFDNIQGLLDQLVKDPPDVVFNAMEAFRGVSALDMTVPAVLDALDIPYTGCAPAGLIVARDKALTKKVLAYHGISVPHFACYRIGGEIARPSDLRFPLIVKPRAEDASQGIAESSVVNDDQAFKERVSHVHGWVKCDAIVEELIPGRELYVGIIGNEDLQVLPVVEMTFGDRPRKPNIATYKAKWDEKYRRRRGIKNVFPEDIPETVLQRLRDVCSTSFRALDLRDYGRLDVRLTAENEIFVLEANPNPYIAFGEDLSNAAEAAGMEYAQLIDQIIEYAMCRSSRRNGKGNGKKASRPSEEVSTRPNGSA